MTSVLSWDSCLLGKRILSITFTATFLADWRFWPRAKEGRRGGGGGEGGGKGGKGKGGESGGGGGGGRGGKEVEVRKEMIQRQGL